MKKLFVVAVLLAVAAMATGCITGTVKKVCVKYSYPDYDNSKIITKCVINKACDEKPNLAINIDTGGDFPTIGTGLISSDTAGIWMHLVHGSLVDPSESCRLYKADMICNGVIRVCGTGTWDAQHQEFSVDANGKYIMIMDGAAELCGTGKLMNKDCYRGIMNMAITPGFAYMVNVKDGQVSDPIPVQANISLPCIPVCCMP